MKGSGSETMDGRSTFFSIPVSEGMNKRDASSRTNAADLAIISAALVLGVPNLPFQTTLGISHIANFADFAVKLNAYEAAARRISWCGGNGNLAAKDRMS